MKCKSPKSQPKWTALEDTLFNYKEANIVPQPFSSSLFFWSNGAIYRRGIRGIYDLTFSILSLSLSFCLLSKFLSLCSSLFLNRCFLCCIVFAPSLTISTFHENMKFDLRTKSTFRRQKTNSHLSPTATKNCLGLWFCIFVGSHNISHFLPT